MYTRHLRTKIPTQHWFLTDSNNISEYLLEQGKQMISAAVRRRKEMEMLKAVTVAFDGHKRPCHSDNEDLTVKSKPKGCTITIEFFKIHLLRQIIDRVYKSDIQMPDVPY